MTIIHLLTFLPLNLVLPRVRKFQEGRQLIDLQTVDTVEVSLADVLLKIDDDRANPTFLLLRDEVKKVFVVRTNLRSQVNGFRTKDTVVGSRRKMLREDLKTATEENSLDDLVLLPVSVISVTAPLRWALLLRAQQRGAG